MAKKDINVGINFTANTSQAQTAIQGLQQTLNQIANGPASALDINAEQFNKASSAAKQLAQHLNSAYNATTGNIDLSKLDKSLRTSGTNIDNLSKGLLQAGDTGKQAFTQLARSIAEADQPIMSTNKLLGELWTTMKNTMKWQLSSSILHGFMGEINRAIGYAKDLDSSLNDIRIVTGKSSDEMARFAEQANKSAKALSTTTTDYTKASLIYYQQGLDGKAVQERTDATIKMANVTGDSAEKVSSQMTAIWNNFANGSKSLEYYADVITALGAATASSSAEIAQGLEKFASVANTVGLSYEYATSALATIVATTRQSADTVGTGLRTIFSRLQSLSLGETLDDGVDLTKYSKALETVGVSVLDASGKMRDMDTILNDLAGKWEQLDQAQKVALAETVGGVRQYTNLIALMDNWDFMERNLGVAGGAEGTLSEQADIYAESWEAAHKRSKASMEAIYSDIINSDTVIDFTNAWADVISGIDDFIDAMGGIKPIVVGIGALFLSVFSKDITPAISNLTHNISVLTLGAQKTYQNFIAKADKKFSTITNDSQYGFSDSQKTAIQNEMLYASANSKVQASLDSLSNSERQNVIAQLESAKALKDKVTALKEEAEALRESAKQKASNFKIDKEGAANQIIKTQASAYAQKSASLLSYGRTEEAVDAATTGAIINQSWNGAKTQIQEVLSRMATDSINGDYSNVQGQYEEIVKIINETLRGLDEEPARVLAMAFKQLIPESMKKARDALDQMTDDTRQKGTVMSKGTEQFVMTVEEAEQELQNYGKQLDELKSGTKEADKDTEEFKQKEKAISDAKKELREYVDLRKSQAPLDEDQQRRLEELQKKFDSNKGKKIQTDMLNTANASGIKKVAQATKEVTEKEKEAAAAAQRFKDVIANIDTSHIMGIGEMFGKTSSAIMSVSMGVNSVKAALDALNNPDLSGIEKIAAVAMPATMAFTSLTSALKSGGAIIHSLIGSYKALNAIQEIQIKLTKDQSLTDAKRAELQQALSAKVDAAKGRSIFMTWMLKKAEDGAALSGVKMWLAILGPALVVAAAIAIVVVAINQFKKSQREAAEEAAKLAKYDTAYESLRESVANIKNEYDELTSAIEKATSAQDKYTSTQDKLDNLAVGTQEYKKALVEANQAVLDLIEATRGLGEEDFDLGTYLRVSNGRFTINEEGMKALSEQQDKATAQQSNLQMDYLSASSAQKQAQVNKQINDTIKAYLFTDDGEEPRYITTREYANMDVSERAYTEKQNFDIGNLAGQIYKALQNNDLQIDNDGNYYLNPNATNNYSDLEAALDANQSEISTLIPVIQSNGIAIQANTAAIIGIKGQDNKYFAELNSNDQAKVEEIISRTVNPYATDVDLQKIKNDNKGELLELQLEKLKAAGVNIEDPDVRDAVKNWINGDSETLETKFTTKNVDATTGKTTTEEADFTLNRQALATEYWNNVIADQNYDAALTDSSIAMAEYRQGLIDQFGEDMGNRIADSTQIGTEGQLQANISGLTREEARQYASMAGSVLGKYVNGDSWARYVDEYGEGAAIDVLTGTKGTNLLGNNNIYSDSINKLDASDIRVKDDDNGGQTIQVIIKDENGNDTGGEISLEDYMLQEYEKDRTSAKLAASAAWSDEKNDASQVAYAKEELKIDQSAVDTYTESIYEQLKAENELGKSEEELRAAAADVAETNLYNQAVFKKLTTAVDKYGDAIKKGDETNLDYINGIDAFKQSLSQLFKVDFDTKYITDNLDLILRAAKGDIKALDELAAHAVNLQIENLDLDEDVAAKLTEQTTWLQQNIPDIEIGAKLSDIKGYQAFADTVAEMVWTGKAGADELNDIFGNISCDPQVERVTVPLSAEQQQTWTTSDNITIDGQTISANDSFHTYNESTGELTYIKVNGTKTAPKSAGSSPKKSGGGGGGSKKKEKKVDDERDRYHTVTQQLEDLNNNMDKLGDLSDRAFGAEKLANMQAQVDLYDDLIAKQQEYIDEIQSYLALDTQKLYDLDLNPEFDENGVLTNYDEIIEKMVNDYNSGNLDDDTYEERKKAIEKYVETNNLAQEQEKTLLDMVNKQKDAWLEMVNTEVELKIDIDADKLKMLEFLLDRLSNDAWDGAERLKNFEQQLDKAVADVTAYQEGIRDLIGDEGYDALLNGDMEYLESLDLDQNTIDQLNEYKDGLVDATKEMLDTQQKMQEQVLNTFKAQDDEVQRAIDGFGDLNNVIEHYNNIVDIVGRGTVGITTDMAKKMRKVQQDNLNNVIASAKTQMEQIAAQRAIIEKEYVDALADGTNGDLIRQLEEQLKEMDDMYNESHDQFLQAWEDALQAAKDIYEATIDDIFKDWEKNLSPIYGSLAALSDAFERQKMLDDDYLDDYQKVYELNKLNRDIQNSIDDTDNIAGKKELIDLQNEINELQNSDTEISEYQLEVLQKRFELKKAEIALSETENALNQVRLRQDNEGNWGYVYTADSDAVAEAESEYADKLYELQELNSQYIKDLQDNIVSTQQDMEDALKAIHLEDFTDEAAYYAAKNAIIDDYKQQMGFLFSELAAAFENNQNLYDNEMVAYAQMTNTKMIDDDRYLTSFNNTVLSQQTGYETLEEYQGAFTSSTATMADQISEALEEMQASNEAAFNAAGTAMEGFSDDFEQAAADIGANSEELSNEVDDLAQHAQNAMQAVSDFIDSWKTDYLAAVAEIVGTNETLYESLSKLKQELADYDAEKAAQEQRRLAEEEAERKRKEEEAKQQTSSKDSWDPGGNYKLYYSTATFCGYTATATSYASQKDADLAAFQTAHNLYKEQQKKRPTDTRLDTGGYTGRMEYADSGMYTGEWENGSVRNNGRLAWLHQKELVLNAHDTENMLEAVNVVRAITEAINLQALNAAMGLGEQRSAVVQKDPEQLEQTVHITAEFPSVQDRNEIEAAFENLLGKATQFANRRRN